MEDPFQKPKLPVASLSLRILFLLKLILGGIFVILILTSVFYWWYFNKNYTLSLVPVDSVLYVSVKSAIWPGPALMPGQQKYEIANLPIDNFYQHLDEIFNFEGLKFKKDILPYISQAAFALVPNQQDSALDWVFIFKLKPRWLSGGKTGARDLVEKSLAKQNYSLKLNKNIFVIATSQNAREKIKEVKEGTVFSLASQVNQKQLNSSFFNLYLNTDQLKPYLPSKNDLLVKIFQEAAKDDVYLNLEKKASGWYFKSTPVGTNQTLTNYPLTNYLPDNFLFFSSGVNLVKIFSDWKNFDLALADSLEELANILTMVYQFDWQKDIFALFNQGADVAIFNAENQTALGFDFVVVLPKPETLTLDNLEKLIKIVLAQKLPQKVTHLLPDKTEVIELQTRPEAFLWQSKDLAGLTLRYLAEPQLNFSIAYTVLANKIFIASSNELLAEFIASQAISLADLTQKCGIKGQGDLIVFNKDFQPSFFQYLSPEQLVLIKAKNDWLEGCLFEK